MSTIITKDKRERAILESADGFTLDVIPLVRATIPITGTSPLIAHRFSEKAKGEIINRQNGIKKVGKEPRIPEEEFEAAKHIMTDPVHNGQDGFPVVAFKAATVGALRQYSVSVKDMSMVALRGLMYFKAYGSEQLVPISYSDCIMREDYVSVGQGKDIRFRPQYNDWSTSLVIDFNVNRLNPQTVVSLVNAGGNGGVGEWRPEKNASGMYGTYEVDQDTGVTLEVIDPITKEPVA